jgi:hypothetical protein
VQRSEPLFSLAFVRRWLLPVVLGTLALAFMVFRQGARLDRLSSSDRSDVGPWATFMNYLYELPAALGMPDTPSNAMGWSDTLVPAAVPVLGLFACGLVLSVGLRFWGWRKSVVVGSYFVLMSAPLLYLINATSYVGQIRPRYVLPLFTVLVAFVLLPKLLGGSRAPIGCRFTIAQLVAVGVLVSATNSLSLATTEIRYLVGLGEWYAWQNPSDLLGVSEPEWWWGLSGWSPFELWLFGTSAFALALGASLWAFRFHGALEGEGVESATG